MADVENRRRLINNEPLDHRISPEYMFSESRRSAGRVKKTLDDTLASKMASLQKDDVTSVLYMETKWYKMLSDLYEKNVQLINIVVAYLNDAAASGTEDESLNRLYAQLTTVFQNMENEMRRVLALPSSEIAEQFEAFKMSVLNMFKALQANVRTHPKKHAAVVGGVAGAVVLHKYFSTACVSAKLLAKLGVIQCTEVGWATAFGVGALGGVFLVVVGACVYNLLIDQKPEMCGETPMQFEAVSQGVDFLKEALQNSSEEFNKLEEDLRKIAAYWDHFNDFDPATDDNDCPVCLGPLQQPVRFRGCTGRHFHCLECREDCLRTSAGPAACTICRQEPLAP